MFLSFILSLSAAATSGFEWRKPDANIQIGIFEQAFAVSVCPAKRRGEKLLRVF